MKTSKLLWLLLVPATALALITQILYGHLGFNPTDEGFILAMSRRILDGQLPHRDFISIRPALSPLLHVPEVWLGGNYTFYLSRFLARLQVALSCFLWALIFFRQFRLPDSWRVSWVLLSGFISYLFSTYYFNLMAWHTLDGLFLVTVGFFLVSESRWRIAGYFVLGLSCLTKQNFLAVPLAVWLITDIRRPYLLIIALVPSILYLSFIIYGGGAQFLWQQLSSETSLLETGIFRYLANFWFWGGMAAIAVPAFILRHRPRLTGWFFYDLWILLMLFLCAAMFYGKYETKPAFLLAGCFTSAVILYGIKNDWQSPATKTAIIVLVTGWTASISVGMNTPVLFAGPLLAGLFLLTASIFQLSFNPTFYYGRLRKGILVLLLLISAMTYHEARLRNIYRDLPARQLQYSLDGVLPGAAGIYTNSTTYHFLKNLTDVAENAGFRTIAVLPETPAFWVKHSQLNPMSLDWPAGLEVQNSSILQRLKNDLDSLPEGSWVLAQKYQAAPLSFTKEPLDSQLQKYGIITYLRLHWQIEHESDYFRIYTRR
ncbi:MAG: hypothetical protein WD077_08205 [Bacteroidia bacterium]